MKSFFSPPPASEEELICPKCAGSIQALDRRPGDVIAIEPLADKPLEIGDVVVFDPSSIEEDHSDQQPLQLKRVVGLPGQKVEIRDGELWVDGSQHIASTDLFIDRAILVDQTLIESSTDAVPAWITYLPSSLYPREGREARRHASNLLDESPWDLDESREFQVVHDYAIELATKGSSLTSYELLMKHKGCDLQLSLTVSKGSISLEGQIIVEDQRESIAQFFTYQPSRPIMVALVDGVLRVYNQSELMRHTLPKASLKRLALSEDADFGFQRRSSDPGLQEPYLFALKVIGEKPNEVRLKLFRDVHYRGPRGESFFELAATSGYHVLGDHVAASLDSRQRYAKGIPQSAIVGKATRIKETDNLTQIP